MDLKVFGKLLEKHNLWGKPIEEMTREEVAKLGACFQDAHVKSDKHCGVCYYQGWETLQSVCTHPEHHGNIYPYAVNLLCPHYSYWADKETAMQPLGRVS